MIRQLGVTGAAFTANLASTTAAAALAALRILTREPQRISELESKVTYLRTKLRSFGCAVAANGGPLLHVIAGAGSEIDALMLWKWAWEHGVYVHPALFPMVPLVRVTLAGTMPHQYLDRVAQAIAGGVRFATANPLITSNSSGSSVNSSSSGSSAHALSQGVQSANPNSSNLDVKVVPATGSTWEALHKKTSPRGAY